MKLHKALKLKNRLAGEIAALKEQISNKNSYLTGSLNVYKYNVEALYVELLSKTQELVNLKIVINEANNEIQSKIYSLSEYKSLISFWNDVSVVEGDNIDRFSRSTVMNYSVQVDEERRNKIVAEFQVKVDALQEEIDTYNYTTEVQWDEKSTE